MFGASRLGHVVRGVLCRLAKQFSICGASEPSKLVSREFGVRSDDAPLCSHQDCFSLLSSVLLVNGRSTEHLALNQASCPGGRCSSKTPSYLSLLAGALLCEVTSRDPSYLLRPSRQ